MFIMVSVRIVSTLKRLSQCVTDEVEIDCFEVDSGIEESDSDQFIVLPVCSMRNFIY